MNIQNPTLNDQETAHWLAFSQLGVKGLGLTRLTKLQEHFGSLTSAWQAPHKELSAVIKLSEPSLAELVAKRQTTDPVALLQACHSQDVAVLAFCNDAYPFDLKQIADPPVVLFVKGDATLVHSTRLIAVVGTRNPSAYGQKITKEISQGLSQNGVTIVSGMAQGIDTFAHRTAIENGAKTIAVLGSGVDICYPAGNRPLFRMLENGEHGALLSEYFPTTKPQAWHFPQRNRIVAGLSKATVVIEAGVQSGALITGRIAFEQNRQVFAVPGRIDAPLSAGTNSLIQQDIAHLTVSYNDIVKEMGWVDKVVTTDSEGFEFYGQERDVYDLLSNEPVHFDVLVAKTAMSVGELSATITMLELANAVCRLPGDWYIKN